MSFHTFDNQDWMNLEPIYNVFKDLSIGKAYKTLLELADKWNKISITDKNVLYQCLVEEGMIQK